MQLFETVGFDFEELKKQMCCLTIELLIPFVPVKNVTNIIKHWFWYVKTFCNLHVLHFGWHSAM